MVGDKFKRLTLIVVAMLFLQLVCFRYVVWWGRRRLLSTIYAIGWPLPCIKMVIWGVHGRWELQFCCFEFTIDLLATIVLSSYFWVICKRRYIQFRKFSLLSVLGLISAMAIAIAFTKFMNEIHFSEALYETVYSRSFRWLAIFFCPWHVFIQLRSYSSLVVV